MVYIYIHLYFMVINQLTSRGNHLVSRVSPPKTMGHRSISQAILGVQKRGHNQQQRMGLERYDVGDLKLLGMLCRWGMTNVGALMVWGDTGDGLNEVGYGFW